MDVRRPLYQSDESYAASMREINRRIRSGVALSYYDSTTPGAKNTECSWGLCDDEIQKAQDGVYTQDGHVCPHDSRGYTVEGVRNDVNVSRYGCFYHCMVFKKIGSAKKRSLKATEPFVETPKAGVTP